MGINDKRLTIFMGGAIIGSIQKGKPIREMFPPWMMYKYDTYNGRDTKLTSLTSSELDQMVINPPQITQSQGVHFKLGEYETVVWFNVY